MRKQSFTKVDNATFSAKLRLPHMLRESSTFLWLRLISRIFQAIPIMMLGRTFGSEVVGIVGAFARINELLNFPFTVIGNALAVRAPGVLVKGTRNARALWDTVSRFGAVSLMLAVSIYLGAEVVARVILPSSHSAARLIAILSVTVVTTGMASVIAPMSDYVGALRSRNILLTIFAIGQIPVIWIGSHFFGETGGIVSYVVVLVLMNLGYVKIALTVFFPAEKYRLRSEFSFFIVITAVAVLLTMLAHWAFGFEKLSAPLANNVSLLDIVLSWSIVRSGFFLYEPAKRFFITRVFFEFTDPAQAGS
jgi:O-antigen/teichoic acid export membrane protein